MFVHPCKLIRMSTTSVTLTQNPPMTNSPLRSVLALLCTVCGLALPTEAAGAQGCEPIRFTVPVNLGGGGEAYQAQGSWRATLAYRKLLSDQWFIGTRRNDRLAPGGSSPVFDIHTMVVDVAYAINDRFTARVSVPFSSGKFSRTWADGNPHTQSATGIGDISAQVEGWLLNPRSHERGNISFGLGVKAPTGDYKIPSQFYLASGPVDFPADQTIQPGDGGWAVLTQVLAFRQLNELASLYASGSYMISPKDQSDVRNSPVASAGLPWSVPDVYSVRTGTALNVLPDHGVAVSLGARLDGIPVRDLVGGGDINTVKRSARIYFVEPGVSLSRGQHNITVSLPWRVGVNRLKSLTEQLPTASATANSGGFAQYLVFASYSRRF